jgi:hypothetical protein
LHTPRSAPSGWAPEVLERWEPSHSIVATAADDAMHYQGMLHSDVWSGTAVEEGSRERYREPAYGPIERGHGASDLAGDLA